MLDSDEHRYLWTIVPPSEIAQQIDAMRQEFAANFQCFQVLKPPVHLTLYTILELTDAEVEEQAPKFRKWVASQPPFTLELKNFSFFENPKRPVVFIDVAPNQMLKTLNTGITRESKKLFELYDPGRQTIHPHFTIGYRDIPPEIFPQVKQAYNKRQFNAAFKVENLCLFRHNKIRWELQHQFPLSAEVIEQGNLW